MMVAALYVETNGVYYGLPDVDPWDKERDARLYTGPHPVVAHPPCERWSRLAHIHKHRIPIGADDGCFLSALRSVQRCGGVLEHPAGSAAWSAFFMNTPPTGGGWVRAHLMGDGWTCQVEQGHYGHRARKATWLYACGVELPSLKWGPSDAETTVEMMSGDGKERRVTPIPFRDLLLNIARSARREVAA